MPAHCILAFAEICMLEKRSSESEMKIKYPIKWHKFA